MNGALSGPQLCQNGTLALNVCCDCATRISKLLVREAEDETFIPCVPYSSYTTAVTLLLCARFDA